jgi:acyl carrier protein
MRLEIARLRELCRESGKGAEKALQVGLGHAAGYLMLEAAFLAHPHVAGDSKLAHCGSRWLRGCRERLLQDCAEGMAAPWMHGDFSPLESAAGAIRGLTGSWMPAALKADIEEQRRRGAWREDPRPEATAQPPAIGSPRPTPVLATTASRTLQREVAGWIGNWIQSRLSSPGSIPVDQGFVELGLDSIDAIELLAAFGECHGIEVDASVLWEFPNLRALSEHLASLLERQSRAAGEEAEPMGEVAAGAGVDDFELLLEQELKQ